MSELKKLRSALISVYHKENLDAIVEELIKRKITVYSTGGTQKYLEDMGVPAVTVESLTNYPSILGGRVKTLHPKIFGGILARQENESDIGQLTEYEIPAIDLVIVDLYPFEETLKNETDEKVIIEKIDIGGISLIRAAAKNYRDVLVIPSQDDYGFLLNLFREKDGASTLEDRRLMATRSFNISSHYDTAIFGYFNNGETPVFKHSLLNSKKLRYGENPHQEGYFYGDIGEVFKQLHGKEISYNNLVDIDGAIALIDEFPESGDPAAAIIKHTNACGLSVRSTLLEAWKASLAGDPVSAFGGIIACNKRINKQVAEEMDKLFFEVIIAPGYEPDALDILKQKKNRIILERIPGASYQSMTGKQFKSTLNGVIEQDYDRKTETSGDLNTVTKRTPTLKETDDLLFANIAVKHLKSNCIVLVKDKQVIGSGVGQTSRVDALKQAAIKAKSFGFSIEGGVMASDAFFPFPDCVEIACQEGIKAVIQPGGSIRDKESIDYCDAHDMAMVTTGTRHFKH